MHRRLCAMAVVALCVVTLGAGPGERYTNGKFGFSFVIPASATPDNNRSGHGLRAKLGPGREIVVYAYYNALDEELGERMVRKEAVCKGRFKRLAGGPVRLGTLDGYRVLGTCDGMLIDTVQMLRHLDDDLSVIYGLQLNTPQDSYVQDSIVFTEVLSSFRFEPEEEPQFVE